MKSNNWRDRKSFLDSSNKKHSLSSKRFLERLKKILNLKIREDDLVVYTQEEAIKLQKKYREKGYITRVIALNDQDYLIYISDKPLKTVKV